MFASPPFLTYLLSNISDPKACGSTALTELPPRHASNPTCNLPTATLGLQLRRRPPTGFLSRHRRPTPLRLHNSRRPKDGRALQQLPPQLLRQLHRQQRRLLHRLLRRTPQSGSRSDWRERKTEKGSSSNKWWKYGHNSRKWNRAVGSQLDRR